MKKGVMYTAGSIIILIICLIAFVLPSSLGRATNNNALNFGNYNDRKILFLPGTGKKDHVSVRAFLAFCVFVRRINGFSVEQNAHRRSAIQIVSALHITERFYEFRKIPDPKSRMIRIVGSVRLDDHIGKRSGLRNADSACVDFAAKHIGVTLIICVILNDLPVYNQRWAKGKTIDYRTFKSIEIRFGRLADDMEIALFVDDQRVKAVKTVLVGRSIVLDKLALTDDMPAITVEIVAVSVTVNRQYGINM